MAVFVEADDEEPVLLALARSLAESGGEALLEKATALHAAEDTAALLALLNGAVGFSADAEAAFLVIAHSAGALPEEAAAAAIVAAVLDRVADASADAPALRLRILFGVFNAVPHGRVRLAVLLRTLAFATATGQAAALSHVVLRVDAWAAEWGVSAAELRALRLAVYELLSRGEPASQAAFTALVAYLALYEASQALHTRRLLELTRCAQGEAAPVLAEVKVAAAKAATLFIAAPSVFQCDLLQMAAVRQLEGDAHLGAVHRLLTIFLTGRLADYSTFAAASKALLAEHGLEHEACVTKMRLLSLAALGAEAGAAGVPYDLVRETLCIEAGAVEAWVVRAISAKVVEAKMDQVRERVLITKHVHRTFGPAQWEALRTKLQHWRDATAAYATA